MVPAYTANVCATLLGSGTPIDLGKNFFDKKRILGDGKTYKGFINGSLCGAIMGAAQIMALPYIAPHFTNAAGDALITASYIAIITMPVGALLGDMTKSFIKRRIGFDRGEMLPGADQLDFVAGAWLLTYIFDPAWFASNFTIWVIIMAILVTPPLHLLSNIIGFRIGKKKVPW
ncbi:CDP-2,3-bis-(O-geranylgeranyl)-sn-glycerol synthase [Methanooceanicella nereidis]